MSNNFKKRTFILMDGETTGFNADKHQLLEIGFLIIRDLKIIGEYEFKIKHKEYTLTLQAMESNGINLVEHEEEAIEASEAVNNIIEILNEYGEEKGLIPIGQNVDFDLRFLNKLFYSNGRIADYNRLISYRKLDLMQVALIKNMEGKIELEKLDLDSILKCLGIEYEGARHRALIDCRLEYEALVKLLTL